MSYRDIFSLKGKTALITGGAGYFGQFFVRGMIDFGIEKVIIVEKPNAEDKAKVAENALTKEFPDKILLYETDLYNTEQTDAIYEQILQDHQVDILVNNAFEFSPRTGFGKVSVDDVFFNASKEQIYTAFSAGVWWAFQATQKFGKPMKERGGGSIINITSPLGVLAPSPQTYIGYEHSPNPPGYGIVKAGLIQLTRYTAMFLAPVRVNALSPGVIPNLEEKSHRAGKSYEDGFLDNLAKKMALNRFGKPEELIGCLVYLASDASSYVTGQNHFVDGGWTVHI